jgi:hypothetical protein
MSRALDLETVSTSGAERALTVVPGSLESSDGTRHVAPNEWTMRDVHDFAAAAGGNVVDNSRATRRVTIARAEGPDVTFAYDRRNLDSGQLGGVTVFVRGEHDNPGLHLTNPSLDIAGNSATLTSKETFGRQEVKRPTEGYGIPVATANVFTEATTNVTFGGGVMTGSETATRDTRKPIRQTPVRRTLRAMR